jgi:uncharacterized protein (TIGR03435 family)
MPSDPDPAVGPEWIRSDRFTIEAKGDGAAPEAVMRGPMLQAVLEDRFKLKIHHETREVPVDELIVAKTGSKLTPFKPGACVPFDWGAYPSPPLEPGQHRCDTVSERDKDGHWVLATEGMTLDEVAAQFTHSDRPVINKTGLTGIFAFRVVYEGAPDFNSAVKDQLGLELRPARARREFLILDHAERPTPNDAPAITAVEPPPAKGVVNAPLPPHSQPTAPAQTAAPTPVFDVVSVKPCNEGDLPQGVGIARGRSAASSPGRALWNCQTVALLIYVANVGRGPLDLSRIVGGPAWIKSEHYTIEAKAEGNPSPDLMDGPMLQALLEDRFKLKLHRETREVPGYALTVAKSGFKLRPAEEGSCTPVNPPTAPAMDQKPLCASVQFRSNGQDMTVEAHSQGLPWFAGFLGNFGFDHRLPVVDKTGITGAFDFHLEYARESAPSDGSVGPSIEAVLQEQFGLRLEPIKTSGEFLVIDHIERPAPNGPAAVLK